MIDSKFYDADYYERGIESGKSLYQNYRWLPEQTCSMAAAIIDYLSITRDHKTCDFGCGKGFLVRALRLLHRQAWGCDVSEYAINSSDNETRQFLKIPANENFIPFDKIFDFVISKDVFEHLDEEILVKVLQEIKLKSKKLFAVVPLGKDGKYIIPAYEWDITHRIRKNEDWWKDIFENNGWKVKEFSYYVLGIKESWKNFERGNGFFLLERNG